MLKCFWGLFLIFQGENPICPDHNADFLTEFKKKMVSNLKLLDVKFNSRIIRTRCEINSKLTTKTRRQCLSMSSVSIVDIEPINIHRVASNSENLYMIRNNNKVQLPQD